MSTVDLSPGDSELLSRILGKYKNELSIFVFGSRVLGSAKKYSDIDLAYIKSPTCGEYSISNLKSELEDSDLSITVDLVDLNAVDANFRRIIEEQMVPFFS